jgi:hypothetical protein
VQTKNFQYAVESPGIVTYARASAVVVCRVHFASHGRSVGANGVVAISKAYCVPVRVMSVEFRLERARHGVTVI